MGKPEPTTDRRVVIESVTPAVDHGRFPAKSSVGDRVEVRAKDLCRWARSGIGRTAVSQVAIT
jgi:hypothetical protein